MDPCGFYIMPRRKQRGVRNVQMNKNTGTVFTTTLEGVNRSCSLILRKKNIASVSHGRTTQLETFGQRQQNPADIPFYLLVTKDS